VNRHMFWEVQRMIQGNKSIQTGSTFYEWMGTSYATSISG
jgi:hypothetical protein